MLFNSAKINIAKPVLPENSSVQNPFLVNKEENIFMNLKPVKPDFLSFESQEQKVSTESLQNSASSFGDIPYKRLNDTDLNILNKNLERFSPDSPAKKNLFVIDEGKNIEAVSKQLEELKVTAQYPVGNKFSELNEKRALISFGQSTPSSTNKALNFIYSAYAKYKHLNENIATKTCQLGNSIKKHPLIQKIRHVIPQLKKKDQLEVILDKATAIHESMTPLVSTVSPFGEAEKNTESLINMMATYNLFESKMKKLNLMAQRTPSKVELLWDKAVVKSKSVYMKVKERILG